MICLKETWRHYKLSRQQSEFTLTFGLVPNEIHQWQIVFTNHDLFTMVGKIYELRQLRLCFRDVDVHGLTL